MPTLIPEAVSRIARKQHECRGNGHSTHHPDCPRTIRPGQPYVEYLGETPAYQSGSAHSIPCAKWLEAEES